MDHMVDISFQQTIENKSWRFNHRVAAIIESDGKFLIHKVASATFTFLPGGRVQLGETTAQALVREMEEELGLKVNEDEIFLRFVVENFFESEGNSFHEVGMYYHLTNVDISALPKDGEVLDGWEFYWKTPAEFASMNMQPEFLKDALVGDLSIRHIVDHGKPREYR